MWKMEIEDCESFGSLIMDGSKVWVHWPESNYRGWDFGIPSSSPMELSSGPTFTSPSSLWDPMQASIKNLATGEVVFQLSGRFANPVDTQCDGSYLMAGYRSGEMLILDLKNVK